MEQTYMSWLWRQLGDTCVKNLEKHGFDAHFVPTIAEARASILCRRMASSWRSPEKRSDRTFAATNASSVRRPKAIAHLSVTVKLLLDKREVGLSTNPVDNSVGKRPPRCHSLRSPGLSHGLPKK